MIKRTMKRLMPFLAGISLLVSPMKSPACTGARQAGIGFAGVAACNDAHAVYWNQAELPNLKQPEVSYTKQFGDVDKARYDDVLCATFPATEKLGIGVQLMDSSKGNLEKDRYNERENWVKFGAGYILSEGTNSWVYSIGGALTEKNINLASLDENNQKSQRKKSGLEYEASFLAENKNTFITGDDLRLGILAREQFGIDGDETGKNLAVRPAASYTFNDGLGDITLASEFYEMDELIGLDRMLGQQGAGKEYAKPRMGLEQKIGTEEKNIALRIGRDGTANEGNGCLTCGLGITYKNITLNIGYTGNNVGWAEIGVKF